MSLLQTLHDALLRMGRRVGARPDLSLRDLDARTLADIGIDASEIASIDAESRGIASLTRLRIAAAPHPA